MKNVRSEYDVFRAGVAWERILYLLTRDIERYGEGGKVLDDEAKGRLRQVRFSVLGIAKRLRSAGGCPISALPVYQLPNREQHLVALLIGQSPRMGESQTIAALLIRAQAVLMALDNMAGGSADLEMAAELRKLLSNPD